jgi:hypothetical protein
MGCGCEGRRERLNHWWPGLGDKVKEGITEMGNLLRPDMKAIVWLALGALVLPVVLRKLNVNLPGM